MDALQVVSVLQDRTVKENAMNIREKLEQYADIKAEIRDLDSRIRKDEDLLCRLCSSYESDSVSLGKKGKKSLGTVVIHGFPEKKYNAVRERIKKRKEKRSVLKKDLEKIIDEVEDWINGIPESEMRTIFRLYYISELNWQQVANKMNQLHPRRHYTEDALRIRHNRFLKKF